MFRPRLLGPEREPVRPRRQHDGESWRTVPLLESLQGARLTGAGRGRGGGHYGERQRRRHNWPIHRGAERDIRQQCRATGELFCC